MEWQGRSWEGCGPPLDSRRIRDVERLLGVEFPDDYRECIRTCHGGRPRDNTFWFDDPQIGRMASSLAILLSLAPDDPENIVETYRRLEPHLPPRTVPFADDGGGDFMCFDYRSQGAPRIVYWAHGDEATIPLADSFSEFLAMLQSS